jgi:hypothetical protein
MIAADGQFRLPDWTKCEAYSHTDKLSLREFAWEFLRRNEEFRENWATARLEYGIAGYDGPTAILVSQHAMPSLARWGCLYASSPTQDALSSLVFWSPDLCASVLRLTAFKLDAKVATTPFILRSIQSPSAILELPQGPQHLLFAEGGRALQLVIEGEDVLRPVRLMTDSAHEGSMASAQLRALQCFNDLRLTGHFFPSNVQRDRLSTRFRNVLRILDGHLSGASNHEIAKVVLKDQYSDEKWDSPDYALRDRVRKALARGIFLMQQGYRKLLS